MEQKIPKVSDSDIRRIISRDFRQSKTDTILDILKSYKSQSEKGRNRIYADILKLSKGDIGLLRKYVKDANTDYRDIISASEYPGYSKYSFDYEFSEEEEKQIIDADWKQYQEWFSKK